MGYPGAQIGGILVSFWGYPESHFTGTPRVNLEILLDDLGGSLGSLGAYFGGTLGSVLEKSRNTLGVH